MSSVNKVILVGHLGHNPSTKTMQNGDVVCSISIATSETWKDKASGEKREATEWHRVVLYRRLSEIADKYLAKGAQVYIEGALRTRKWQDKSGVDRYTTEIIADAMKMLGSKKEGVPHPADAPPPPPSRSAQGAPPDYDDDIPFAPRARGIAGHAL